MGSLKTFILSAFLTLGAPFASAHSLVETFAMCAGRFSAEMEHAWLLGNASDDVTRQRAEFIDLLAAATPQDARAKTLHMRIEAKAAHARMLTLASFAPDVERARWAQLRSDAHRRACLALLLSS